MNDTNRALDILTQRIQYIVQSNITNLKYDKTFKATIWGKTPDGKYQISYKSQLYSVPNALGTNLNVGQLVWVKIPSGIFRDMHICGIR